MKNEKKSTVSGIEVPETLKVALSGVNFAPYNPRVMDRDQSRALRSSLLKHGMVLNLVVQRQSSAYGPMVLIGGHQRVRVMREICAEKTWPEPTALPAVVLDVSDEIAKQLNISLNRIDGDFDPDKLGKIFADIRLDMSADDILASGFYDDDIDQLVRLCAEPGDLAKILEDEAAAISPIAGVATLAIDFATESAKIDAKEILREMAKDEKCRSGDVVLRLLRAQKSANRPRETKRPQSKK